MTVFKTILKILNRLKGMLILYTVMLISITMINQTADSNINNFEESKPDMLIVNKDNDNIVTNSFINYINKIHHLQALQHHYQYYNQSAQCLFWE